MNTRRRAGLLGLLIAIALGTPGQAETVTLTSARDNTLLGNEVNSNGIGPYMFSGRTSANGGNTQQRAVFKFNLAGFVPAGATITSAEVTLRLLQAGPSSGTQTHSLHRLLADWGEGDSPGFGGAGVNAEPGDATWLHTFFPGEFWTTPGGDFVPAGSASRSVGQSPGFLTWASTPALVADVQAWVDDPSSSHGWVLIGNEAGTGTSKKFATRENMPCRADITGGIFLLPSDGEVDAQDFLELIAQWGSTCPCTADITGPADVPDGIVDALDYLLMIEQWGTPGRCLDETDGPRLRIEYTMP